jgi:hypothetical protein
MIVSSALTRASDSVALRTALAEVTAGFLAVEALQRGGPTPCNVSRRALPSPRTFADELGLNVTSRFNEA